MRKIAFMLLAISFLFLSLFGCKPNEQITPTPYFTAKAQIKSQDTTASADIMSQPDGLTITFNSPDILEGLTYRYVNSTLYIDYHGLKCTTNSDYLPSFAFVDVLYETILSLRDTSVTQNEANDNYAVFKGENESGGYTLYADVNTGELIKIVPSYTDCEITFTKIE